MKRSNMKGNYYVSLVVIVATSTICLLFKLSEEARISNFPLRFPLDCTTVGLHIQQCHQKSPGGATFPLFVGNSII